MLFIRPDMVAGHFRHWIFICREMIGIMSFPMENGTQSRTRRDMALQNLPKEPSRFLVALRVNKQKRDAERVARIERQKEVEKRVSPRTAATMVAAIASFSMFA